MIEPFSQKELQAYQDFLKKTRRFTSDQPPEFNKKLYAEFLDWQRHQESKIKIKYRAPSKALSQPQRQKSFHNQLKALITSILLSGVCHLILFILLLLIVINPPLPPGNNPVLYAQFETFEANPIPLTEPKIEMPQLKNPELEPVALAPQKKPEPELFEPEPLSELETPETKPEPTVAKENSEDLLKNIKLDEILPIKVIQPKESNRLKFLLEQNPTDLKYRLNPESRRLLLEHNGGSKEVEHAVNLALQWLAIHQNPDGSWTAGRLDRACRRAGHTRCGGEAQYHNSFDEAVTALALMAFLGGGHSTDFGQHKLVVKKAARWLIGRQKSNGSFGSRKGSSGYSTGIVTLCLLELEQLSDETQAYNSAAKALEWIINAQEKNGGWDYNPGTGRGDVSITTWCFLSLLRGLDRGFEQARLPMLKSLKFMRSQMLKDGRVYYDTRALPYSTLGCIASGLLVEQYRWNSRRGAIRKSQTEKILASRPVWNGLREKSNTPYYWHAASLALFHQGGNEWFRWWQSMESFLLKHQVQKGNRKGSYDPPTNGIGRSITRCGGRVVVTAFAALTLECPWRYLPLYRNRPERRGSPQTSEAFIATLLNPEASSRQQLKALGKLHKNQVDNKVVSRVEKLLESEDTILKMEAARFLSRRKNPKALPIIFNHIQQNPLDLRSHAAANWLTEDFPDHPQTVPVILKLIKLQTNFLVSQQLLRYLLKTNNPDTGKKIITWASQLQEPKLKETALKIGNQLAK